MRVLVTGGTGFVGRALVPALVRGGHMVRVAVRAPRAGLPYESTVVGDIGPNTDWSHALRGIDSVVHLAGRAHVMRDDARGTDEYRSVNTLGALQLARAAAVAGARRFVLISTVKVNGESTTGTPFRADDPPVATDPYSRSKLEAELGLLQITGLEPVIVRPPLVYGPGAKGNLARLCRLAMSGVPVPLAGIDNRRDLVGVANLASLIEVCLTHAAAPGEVFLVSDGEPMSTPQLYSTICRALDRPSRMFRVPLTAMRLIARTVGLSAEVDRLTQSLEIDTTKTRAVLGWEPPVKAADGIAEMARAFRAAPG